MIAEQAFSPRRLRPSASKPPGIVARVTIPATSAKLAEAITEVLGDGRARTEADLNAAIEERGLRLGARETITDVLLNDDLPDVWPLADRPSTSSGPGSTSSDRRYMLLPAFLRDRTFTHRVSAEELEHDYLEVAPDLEPVAFLAENDFELTDNSRVREVFAGLDAEVLNERGVSLAGDGVGWLLEPGTLQRAGVGGGDLLGVTVRKDGLELARVADVVAAPDLGVRLAEAVAAFGDDAPGQVADAVWLVCADHDDLFRTATAPLTEAFDGAGLVYEGEQVGPAGFDFGRWRVRMRVDRVTDLYELTEDEGLAVLTLTSICEKFTELLAATQDAIDEGASADDLLADGHSDPEPSPGEPSAPSDGSSDHTEVILATVGFLESPAVAEALWFEAVGADREGAAAVGMFAETYEQQAPRSARAALGWLRGKALDRLGDVAAAEEAYQAAVTLDGAFAPALYDLARIASDRGDAARGLSLLQRAGAPDDDDQVVLLRGFRPVERTDIGRNDRCWCGSGRKYKVCHRNSETLSLADRAAWLYQKAGAFLSDGPWRMAMVDLAEIRAEHWDAPDAIWQALGDPLVADAMLFEGGAFSAFLDERGTLLPDDERLLADQWLLVERSVYEVEAVSPGSGLTVRDLRTGDRHEVHERTASRTLTTGTLFCARIVPAGDTMQGFGGIEPVALGERDALIALLDDEPGPEELVAFLSRRFAPPVLQNTDGDDLVFCEATLRTDDPRSLTSLLDATYERVDDGARWHEFETIDHGQRIRATFVLDGDELRVETNSEPRMDRVLTRLSEATTTVKLIKETRTPADDVREAMNDAPKPGADESPDPADAEVADMLDQVVRQYEANWLDEPIPALAGATPREAAEDPTRRDDLSRLLDSFPPTAPDNPGMMSPDRLRTALGL